MAGLLVTMGIDMKSKFKYLKPAFDDEQNFIKFVMPRLPLIVIKQTPYLFKQIKWQSV